MLKIDILLALRNVFRHKIRSLAILLALCLSGIILLLVGGLYNSLFSMIEPQQIEESGHIKIMPQSGESLILNYSKLKSIWEDNSFIREALPKRQVSGLAGVDERTALFSGEFVYRDHALGVILGKTLAANLKAESGADVNILIGWNGFSIPFEKAILTDSSDRDRVYASIPWEYIEVLGNSDAVSSIALYLTDKSHITKVETYLKKSFAKRKLLLRVSNFSDNRSYFHSVKQIYMNNYYFIIGVIVLTVFFAIFNTVTMVIMERTREIGTLQSFGLTINKIQLLLVLEGLFLWLVGFCLSVVLSYFGQLLINNSGGITLPPPPTVENEIILYCHVPGASYILSFVVLGIVTLSGTIVSTSRIFRMSVIEKLNHI